MPGDLDPLTALRRLVSLIFDYLDAHRDFVRLIAIENLHRAVHLKHSPAIRSVNADVITILESILARGRAQGRFARDCGAVEVHLMISRLCFHRVSNRHTSGAIFGCDLSAAEVKQRHKAMIVDMIVRYLPAE